MVSNEARHRRLVLLLQLYMFLYMLVKHVVHIQTLIVQGEWEKLQFSIFLLRVWVIHIGAYKVKHGWLDLWAVCYWVHGRMNLKRQTHVEFITSKFLYERLSPNLKEIKEKKNYLRLDCNLRVQLHGSSNYMAYIISQGTCWILYSCFNSCNLWARLLLQKPFR